jgi:hypothetical protein
MDVRMDDYAAMPGRLPDNAVGFTRRGVPGGVGYRINMIFRIHRMGKPVCIRPFESAFTSPENGRVWCHVVMPWSSNFSAPNFSAHTPVPAKPNGREYRGSGGMKLPKFEI